MSDFLNMLDAIRRGAVEEVRQVTETEREARPFRVPTTPLSFACSPKRGPIPTLALLMLPPVSRSLTRLVGIVEPMFAPAGKF